MRVIKILVTDEEYDALKEKICDIKVFNSYAKSVSVSDILEHYVSDLCESSRSYGSDERMLANEYFERGVFNY